jgi:hypothetical protein
MSLMVMDANQRLDGSMEPNCMESILKPTRASLQLTPEDFFSWPARPCSPAHHISPKRSTSSATPSIMLPCPPRCAIPVVPTWTIRKLWTFGSWIPRGRAPPSHIDVEVQGSSGNGHGHRLRSYYLQAVIYPSTVSTFITSRATRFCLARQRETRAVPLHLTGP